ncbi:dehydrodolichyl diphosphate synthase complex subunit nus1 [Leguminivora glycinivorella]|uniref:dehydrodolichyl diphosphate synthase complex subunit nus1 n=1 Tax=Leguminivora glycinivorella TaxID=1035111 RepID=UPI00200EA4DC|nr:dehydrodolichyl diphosphate synthase complex subunit nus1 [Leguminivora glycinivorella]
MLSRLLGEFLLFLVHLTVNVLVAVQNVYHQFWAKRDDFPTCELTKREISVVMEHVPRLKKKLHHLVVLAHTEYHSLSDLARVVIWSLVAGIPYVSLYDVTGNLTKEEEKLFLKIEQHKKGVPGYIKWANKPDLNGYTNGINAHTVIINIFNAYDGRPKIAQCVSQIATESCSIDKYRELTVDELNNRLNLMYPSIPDPDVVIYTGAVCRTSGLLPWQIRLTEFIQLSLDHSVNVKSYIGALYKYNKCDQRFGK